IHTRPSRHAGSSRDLFDHDASIAVIEPDHEQPPPLDENCEAFNCLLAMREKHRALYEILPIGVTITDEAGAIIEVNSVCERILGMTAETLLGKSIHDDGWQVIRPDGTPLPSEDYACARVLHRQETLLGQEVGIVRANGEVTWMSIFAAPIPLPGYGVAVIYVDVTKSRTTEDRLRKREQRYRMAVEAGHIGVWEWDITTGDMYLDLNLKHMLGYEDSEIKSHIIDWSQHVHPADRELIERTIRSHLAGETPSFDLEHRMLHKNGSVVWVLTRGIATFDDEGNPVSMTGTDLDITERKLAEDAVEVERRRLFSLLDRLPAFVCLIAPDRTLRFRNRYFVEQFSDDTAPPCTLAFPAGAVANSPTFEVFDTRSLAVWEWTFEETGQIFQVYDYPFEDVDGSPLVLELGIDVTISRRALDALQISEQRYRSITDNLAMGIAMVDGDSRLVAANPKLREWYSHVDFNSKPPCDVLLPGCDVDDRASSHCRRALDGCPQSEVLREVSLPLGTRAMRFNFCPINHEDGGETGSLILMIEDVTERMRDQARLQRAQKLEAMGTLASGIAHEINQPLNALRLYVSSLDMLVRQNEEVDRNLVQSRLGLIMNECDKINEIIIHMRSLVRQEAKGLGRVDLNLALQSALSLVTAQLKSHDIALLLDLQSDLPAIHANPVQVEQVVVNLVVNAMNALEERDGRNLKNGAKLDPTEDVEVTEKLVYIQTRLEAHHVVLNVQDNGPGVADVEDRLFDPFFTTKDPGKGMGLGLSIVHTLVRSWDAEITAGKSPWGGAAFTVRLRPAD
ncbi:MAG: PAS domain S-box protein, partial [Oceanidesulfovibrio sp.]